MNKIKPDILAKISYYNKDSLKNKKNRIPAIQYGCPVFFNNEESGFECRLLLNQINHSIGPGETLENVPIKFLFYEDVKEKLKIGTTFKLWEAGIFAEGEVTKIL